MGSCHAAGPTFCGTSCCCTLTARDQWNRCVKTCSSTTPIISSPLPPRCAPRGTRHGGTSAPNLPCACKRALGNGLLSFLTVDRGRRLIVKNPSVRHLDRFFDFFPTAYLLVLVRDGRSVTQSCMDTFGWSFERSARAWAGAADEIQRFRTAHARRADQWQLVRYEDLLDDLENRLRSILQLVDLDAGCYDMEAARNLPVRGSSVFFGEGRSSVNWEPVQKDADVRTQTAVAVMAGTLAGSVRVDRRRPASGLWIRHLTIPATTADRCQACAPGCGLGGAPERPRIARSHVGAPLRPLRRRLGWLR